MDMLKEILKEVAAHPGAAEILARANTGELSVMDAALQIQNLIEGTDSATSLVKKMDHINEMGIDPEKMVFKHPNGEEGLNPLFEAKLAERLSLDGDIPELRVGALPKGSRPAVPVLTYATDPVVIGLQLKKAQETVEKALEDQVKGYIKDCEKKQYLTPPSLPIDLPGIYECGKTPELLKVDTIPLAEILSVSDKERRELTFSCIGTTQGRRSLVPPISRILAKKFSDHGFKNKVVTSNTRYESTWKVQTWGPEDISDGFNPIVNAASFFFEDFLENVGQVDELYFDLRPLNGYSDRIFGWKCTFHY